MYRYDFHCKMCNSNTFFSLLVQLFVGKRMNFIVLLSLEIVHDTVQYRYCICSLLYHLLRIRLKYQNPLLSYVQETERKYTVNVQCSVQYTLLLLSLMLVMFYCA